ncbi:acyl-CoA-binding domain-containing protein 6-like [Montipora capricornis]|uniref:acyl-CoA-binding domain-containing protein 6-like n=1 Tax=Montipora capricornis TaxID=246305 RepID=UPI0035F1DB67
MKWPIKKILKKRSRSCGQIQSGIADGLINGEHEQIEGKSSHDERNGPKKTQEILGLDLANEDEYWDLWEAVKVDDIDVVKHLREEKNIRFTRVQDNKTILHLGAERNSSKVVMYLLTDGKMDPNVKDEILQINRQDLIGNTALHIACQYDQAKMKTFLLNQGADTTIINSGKCEPDKLTCSQLSGFMAQLVEHCTGIIV